MARISITVTAQGNVDNATGEALRTQTLGLVDALHAAGFTTAKKHLEFIADTPEEAAANLAEAERVKKADADRLAADKKAADEAAKNLSKAERDAAEKQARADAKAAKNA